MYEVLVFAGLLPAAMMTGLMTTLLVVFRPMWDRQPDDAAAVGFRDFVAHAAGNRILTALSLIPALCAAGIAVVGAPGTTELAYAVAGGGVYFVGFFLWTMIFNLPIYRAVAAWTDAPPYRDARALMRRFHLNNAVRLACALATSVLFFLAA